MKTAAAFAVVFAVACAQAPQTPAPQTPAAADCSSRPQPDLPTLSHAQGFHFEAGPGWRRLVVARPWPASTETISVVLLECGAVAPPLAPGERALAVPVKRLATTAAVQVAHLEALGALDRLVAHAGAGALWSPAARQLVARGAVADLGLDGLDPEAVVAAGPDVLLGNPFSAADDHRDRYAAFGVTWLPHAEWVEGHPLGRAEWLHVTAALVGAEAQATTHLAQVREGWQAATASVPDRTFDQRPKVLTGLPWRGTWWVPGADSATAHLIEAAGGRYALAGVAGTGNVPLDLEAVLARAGDAEVWLAPGTATSRAEILRLEPRTRSIAALASGRIVATDARSTPGGGTDWWEGALVRPDLALTDLVAALTNSQQDPPTWHFLRLLPAGTEDHAR